MPVPPPHRGDIWGFWKLGVPKKQNAPPPGAQFLWKTEVKLLINPHPTMWGGKLVPNPLLRAWEWNFRKDPCPWPGQQYAANLRQPRGIPHPSPPCGGGRGRALHWLVPEIYNNHIYFCWCITILQSVHGLTLPLSPSLISRLISWSVLWSDHDWQLILWPRLRQTVTSGN